MRKLIILLLPTLILAGLFFAGKIDFSKPQLTLKDVESIGSEYTLHLKAEDRQSGILKLKVSISQNSKEVSIYSKESENIKEITENIPINPKKVGLFEGKATLKVEATNNSLIKRTTVYQKDIVIDLTPPIISIVDWTRNIINGGTGFVFFKSSEPLSDAEVKIGNYLYRCLDFTYGYVCPFSYPYFEDGYLPLTLRVVDKAGNKTLHSLNYSLKKVNYAKSVLNIDDNFIETKVRPLSDKNIPDKIELFKYVNVTLRKENEDTIHRITSECKNKEPMFDGYFTYLENSAKLGGFADYRKYRYNGQIIEGADAYHKGFDFASIKNTPVKASNKGEVVFTGFLGIYGNTVIIDHGSCVYSLYSHLSEIYVKKGQKVDKNTVIGKTGTTGLAVGDHLHYGVLVEGIEVNPIEWFDPKWLDTRFYTPLKQLKGGQ
ncbi:MAG: M23 family metallopeptidase [Hydrogenothermaceae bacterium]|nr:M23 family metallopeptidase [Hydrogenothermaceae bacterium]